MGVKTNVRTRKLDESSVTVYRGVILKGYQVVWRAPEYRYTRLFAEQDAREHLATARVFAFDHTAWYQVETIK